MRILTIAAIMALLGAGQALANIGCTAKNEVGGECSVSCVEGQAAFCVSADGGATPECSCEDATIDALSRRMPTEQAQRVLELYGAAAITAAAEASAAAESSSVGGARCRRKGEEGWSCEFVYEWAF